MSYIATGSLPGASRRDHRPAATAHSAHEYVDANFAQANCTTSHIAEHLEISASGLCHAYLRTYGITLGEDIRRRRIRMACDLIEASPDQLLKVVASRVGYKRSSYRAFANAFTAIAGVTPSSYASFARQRQRKGATDAPPIANMRAGGFSR